MCQSAHTHTPPSCKSNEKKKKKKEKFDFNTIRFCFQNCFFSLFRIFRFSLAFVCLVNASRGHKRQIYEKNKGQKDGEEIIVKIVLNVAFLWLFAHQVVRCNKQKQEAMPIPTHTEMDTIK